MRLIIFISLLQIFCFPAYSCQDQNSIDKFFESLDTLYKKSDYDDVVFYGKNKDTNEILRITFTKAGTLSEFADSYQHGFFQLETNKSIFNQLLANGAFSPQYKAAGEIKSSLYTNYLEWNIDGSLKIFYEENGSLKKITFDNGYRLYEFEPSQNAELEQLYNRI